MAFYIFKIFNKITKDAELDLIIHGLSCNLMLFTFDPLFDFVFNLTCFITKVKKEYLFDVLNIIHNFIDPVADKITIGNSYSCFVSLKKQIRIKMNEKFKRTSENQEIPKEIQSTQLKPKRTSEIQEISHKIQSTQLKDHKNDNPNHSTFQKDEIIQSSIHHFSDNGDYIR
jgi:hypothetical protein